MLVFAAKDLRALADSYATLQERLDALLDPYASFPYETHPGNQYATHGFLRRFNTMHHCIERVFAILPPEQDKRPANAVLLDTAVYIQSIVMNVFGALDNLTWIWVSEKPLKVGRRQIGLGPKCEIVRGSFSPEMRDYLAAQDSWFNHIIDFRDALAHRIPLYIPPYIVSGNDDSEYDALEARKRAITDNDEYDRLCAEQLRLEVFHPVMKHALDDNKQPVVFHFQLVQDFLTVEEIAQKVLIEPQCGSRPR
jgi:hypothetical protein